MIPVQINTEFYTIPAFGFAMLEVKTGDSNSSYSDFNAPTEVAVPAGGIEVRFLDGSGRAIAQAQRVTTSFEHATAGLSAEDLEQVDKRAERHAAQRKFDAAMEMAWALRKSINEVAPDDVDILFEEPTTPEEALAYVEKLRTLAEVKPDVEVKPDKPNGKVK